MSRYTRYLEKRTLLHVIKYLGSRGGFFYLNLIVLSIAIFLITPLFNHKSSFPILFGYSLLYLGYLFVFTVPPVIFLILIIFKDNTFNRNLFFIIAFVFLAIELGLQFLDRNEPDLYDITYYPQPYVMFTGKPNSTVYAGGEENLIGGQEILDTGRTLNELGFRVDKPLTRKKAADEVRIFVLGGSTVFAGDSLPNTIPGLIEELYRRDGYGNVNVYNFGATSYVSGQELSLLVHTLSDYQPDLVIVYDGGNDFHQPASNDPRPGYPFNFAIYEQGYYRMRNTASLRSIFTSVLIKSKLLNKLFYGPLRDNLVPIPELRESYGWLSDEWADSIVLKYTSNLDKMCYVAKGFDFKLVVFLQPLAHFKSPLVGNEEKLVSEGIFKNYIIRQYNKTRSSFNDLNAKYAGENRCYFSDLSYAFRDYERETFTDFIHIDYEGNKHIAVQMYDFIEQKEILKLNETRSAQFLK